MINTENRGLKPMGSVTKFDINKFNDALLVSTVCPDAQVILDDGLDVLNKVGNSHFNLVPMGGKYASADNAADIHEAVVMITNDVSDQILDVVNEIAKANIINK